TAKMQWSLILLFLMAVSFIVTDCQLCQFHYINKEMTWTEAQQYCREKHTDLVTVTNMKDMKRLINVSDGDWSEAWIGLISKPEFIRTWFWSLPGVEFNESETNWNPGEPTNGESENCAYLLENLKWVDTGCGATKYFVCFNQTNTNHKYHLIKEKKSWQEAQSYCREKHTDLISGTKQLQDEEVEKLMNSISDSSYIGLFRDTWRWSDGSSFSFRHWNKGFNNPAFNRDQCAMTVFKDEGRWKNEDCKKTKPFICYDDKVILIKENKTWKDALTYCRDHHHGLVTITNMIDQISVQQEAQFASTDYVWMGLRYACTLDLWFWVSDEVVSYQNWGSDPPMDDCDMSGAMETKRNHQWFKRNDADLFNFICSKE
uniref:C-type lectin domain-containing protein n=2 Tax=Poecilia formosa TaxID=48698 RepID=A0A096LSV2_POEFO